MSHTKRGSLWLGVLTLGLGLQFNFAEAGQLKVGDTFPDLARFQLEGKLPDSLHGKVVIVDFWASWCSPCNASFPAMEQLQKNYGDKVVVILAVNLDDKRTEMDAFLKKHPVTFTVVRDAGKKLVAAAGIASMPTSFVLDGDGKVRAVHSGFRGEGTQKQYAVEIENLLKTTIAQATP